jgi:hypothetical protein
MLARKPSSLDCHKKEAFILGRRRGAAEKISAVKEGFSAGDKEYNSTKNPLF